MPTAKFIGGPKDGMTAEVPHLDPIIRVSGPVEELFRQSQTENSELHVNTYIYRRTTGDEYQYDGFE